MAYQLKDVPCFNCKFFERAKDRQYDGICKKDGSYTIDHRVCNKLPTNEDKRDAKILTHYFVVK